MLAALPPAPGREAGRQHQLISEHLSLGHEDEGGGNGGGGEGGGEGGGRGEHRGRVGREGQGGRGGDGGHLHATAALPPAPGPEAGRQHQLVSEHLSLGHEDEGGVHGEGGEGGGGVGGDGGHLVAPAAPILFPTLQAELLLLRHAGAN